MCECVNVLKTLLCICVCIRVVGVHTFVSRVCEVCVCVRARVCVRVHTRSCQEAGWDMRDAHSVNTSTGALR